MNKLFFGGIHPKYNKEISQYSSELTEIAPKQVVIPMYQHIGASCEPLVKVGDSVLMGQKIGDGEGLCVPVHSSVSGVVTAIEPRPHSNGQQVMSVVINNDYKDSSVKPVGCEQSLDELDVDTVLGIIREAGIVGMGGAAFPADTKALSAIGKIDTLIANACECEPYITADDTLLRINPEQVFEGMMILNKILSPTRNVIAIEDNKTQAIEALNKLSSDYPSVEITVLPTRYPQGSEKQLIQALTGRQVPPKGLPFQVDCAVFNVSTFAAVYQAVRKGVPLIKRIVTVTGEGIASPKNYTVRIGTPFIDVINEAGGLEESTERVLSGGPMMGVAQNDLSVPVVKATNAVLALTKNNSRVNATACIRCGKCLEVCPMHLQPLYLCRNTMTSRVDELLRLNINDCIECGCCAFTCPAKLELVEKIRLGKKIVKEAAIK